MMHDFALTAKYVVLFDVPVTFDQANSPVPYSWKDNHAARVGVTPRAGGAVRWFEVDPILYSHTLNAYDEGASVVVDMDRPQEYPRINDTLVSRRHRYGYSSRPVRPARRGRPRTTATYCPVCTIRIAARPIW